MVSQRQQPRHKSQPFLLKIKIRTMSTRLKKRVITNVTMEQAQEASSQFATSANKLKKIEAAINERLNKIKDEYKEEITELEFNKNEQMELLEVFAKEQQGKWGKRKSLDLLHCVIGFRTGNPKVVKDKKFTWDAVLELMRKKQIFKRFIRISEEINKEAILSEKNSQLLNSLQTDCYISIDQYENFYIEPKLEEVAA